MTRRAQGLQVRHVVVVAGHDVIDLVGDVPAVLTDPAVTA
jgi:hypothetical protein